MSDKPETLAAILAKYRKDIAGGQFFTPTQEYILRLLDRIEAAAERERIELREDEAKMLLREYAAAPDESLTPSAHELKRELLRLARAHGNAAALREALIYVRDLMRRVRDGDRISSLAFLGVVEHALAAPARNCDRFATVGAAHKAWRATDQERDFADWLFDKAEEVN